MIDCYLNCKLKHTTWHVLIISCGHKDKIA